MPTHIAFLRAVNIGKRAYPMVELRACLEQAGLTDVATHIQTGNVRFTSPLRSRAKIEATLEDLFLTDRGFEVVTMVFSPAELSAIAADAEALHAARTDEGRHYVSLLKHEPSPEAAAELESLSIPGERAIVRGRAVHLLLGDDYHSATLDNTKVEKVLGPATNRNHNVITTLADKWGDA